MNIEEELKKLQSYGERLQPMVQDTVHFVNTALRQGKRVVVEGANAAMLDIDFGEGLSISLVPIPEDLESLKIGGRV